MDRVVCAANRNITNKHFIIGVRHYDIIMCDAMEAISFSFKGVEEYFPINYSEQGFINQRGEFLSRTEAWLVAESAGQIIKRVGGDTANGGTLYSENLY